MKKEIGALGLAAVMAVAGCKGCEDKSLYGTPPYTPPMEEPEEEADRQLDEQRGEFGGSANKVIDSGDVIYLPESVDNVPPKFIIPAGPKGAYRMVGIQFVGTNDTSWLPAGYLPLPVVDPKTGVQFAWMATCPTTIGAEFTPPANIEEIFVTIDGGQVVDGGPRRSFEEYWTRHPNQPSKLPFPPGAGAESKPKK